MFGQYFKPINHQDLATESKVTPPGFHESVASIKTPKKHWRFSRRAMLIVIIFLFLGTGVWAYFFTDIRDLLPWGKPKPEEILQKFKAGQWLDQLPNVPETKLSFELYVSDRDQDVAVAGQATNQNSDGYAVRSAMQNLAAPTVICLDDGEFLQASSGQRCDATAEARPVAGEKICPTVEDKWPDLSAFDGWQYQSNCASNLDDYTWSYAAFKSDSDEKVTCDVNGCVYDQNGAVKVADRLSDSFLAWGQQMSDMFMEMEKVLPSNLQAQGEQRAKMIFHDDSETFDADFDWSGSAKFGSVSIELNMAAILLGDYAYYKVDKFP